MGLMIEESEFESRQEQEIFLFSKLSALALEPTWPDIQCMQGALSSWVKYSGHEVDFLPSSSAEVRNA
jgi:hypothetical protein